MSYKVVVCDVSDLFNDFELGVNTLMIEGWTPQGGILIRDNRFDNRIYAYQAMVRNSVKGKEKKKWEQ